MGKYTRSSVRQVFSCCGVAALVLLFMLAVGVARAIGTAYTTESQALDAAKLALEKGADVNAANDSGDTALHAAAYSGYNTIIPFLLEKGANINAKTKRGDTPFLVANGQGPRVAGDNPYQPESAALLKKLGADTTGYCEWPCLHSKGADDLNSDETPYGGRRRGPQ